MVGFPVGGGGVILLVLNRSVELGGNQGWGGVIISVVPLELSDRRQGTLGG